MVPDAVPLDKCTRALVVKLRHHGDVLLASAVPGALRAAAPALEVDALVYDDTAPMLEGHPALARVHTVGRAWRRLGAGARLAAEWGLFSALRARRYDLIVHLSEHPRGAWLARTLGARYRVAPAYGGRSAFWRNSFSHRFALAKNAGRHMVEWNLDALRRIGVQPPPEHRRVVFVPGAEAERAVDAHLAAHQLATGGFVHLHPASRWRFKCWPAARHAELVTRLAATGQRIVLTAAPEPAERAQVKEILRLAGDACVDLSGRLSIRELGALSARARLFVGVDSMPMHLAAAMGTPVVALFGPSGEREWGPWNVAHRVVSGDQPCRPCGNDGCGGGKLSDCLEMLEVERVWRAARDLLAEPAARAADRAVAA